MLTRQTSEELIDKFFESPKVAQYFNSKKTVLFFSYWTALSKKEYSNGIEKPRAKIFEECRDLLVEILERRESYVTMTYHLDGSNEHYWDSSNIKHLFEHTFMLVDANNDQIKFNVPFDIEAEFFAFLSEYLINIHNIKLVVPLCWGYEPSAKDCLILLDVMNAVIRNKSLEVLEMEPALNLFHLIKKALKTGDSIRLLHEKLEKLLKPLSEAHSLHTLILPNYCNDMEENTYEEGDEELVYHFDMLAFFIKYCASHLRVLRVGVNNTGSYGAMGEMHLNLLLNLEGIYKPLLESNQIITLDLPIESNHIYHKLLKPILNANRRRLAEQLSLVSALLTKPQALSDNFLPLTIPEDVRSKVMHFAFPNVTQKISASISYAVDKVFEARAEADLSSEPVIRRLKPNS